MNIISHHFAGDHFKDILEILDINKKDRVMKRTEFSVGMRHQENNETEILIWTFYGGLWHKE